MTWVCVVTERDEQHGDESYNIYGTLGRAKAALRRNGYDRGEIGETWEHWHNDDEDASAMIERRLVK